MNDTGVSWHYWSVDLPGLDRPAAQELLEIAKEAGMSDVGSLVDPAVFLTLHLDRSTVLAISAVLARAQMAEDPECSEALIVAGYRESLDEWLQETNE